MALTVGLILIWAILCAGFYVSAKGFKFAALKAGAKETTGKVVSKEKTKNLNHRYKICFDHHDKECFFISWDAGKLIFKLFEFEVGQEVKVTYDPHHPENAMVGGKKKNRIIVGLSFFILVTVFPLLILFTLLTIK